MNVSDMYQAFQKLQNGQCLGIVPGTYVACGEGGNFCSALCQIRNLLNEEIVSWDHIDSGNQALSGFKEKIQNILDHRENDD